MKHTHITPLLEALHCDDLLIKLILELWNSERPHFGGDSSHRYNGTDKTCAYCFRPKDWKSINASYYANELQYGDTESISTKFRERLKKFRGIL